jgi:ABC-type lipoprotein export system ATPase subunit
MPAVLSLIGVTKGYVRGVREVAVLKDVSLDLNPGDFACVLGSAGDGKTTLLEVAAGFQSPDRGRVLFDGKDLSRLSERAFSRLRAKDIGCVVNRSAPVLADSVLDHVALPLLSSGRRRKLANRAAAEMLERVGVALAQACVRSPRLLVADELTDTLDMPERNSILGILQSFAREGVAVLITASDGNGAVGCNRLLSLSRGRLIEAEPRPSEAPAPTPDLGDVVPFRATGRGGERPGRA